MTDEQKDHLEAIAAEVINQNVNKDIIYELMRRYGIGESNFGKYLDALGRDQNLFYHRLAGHHPFYDFPIDDPGHYWDFIEHVWISDSSTSQGLPILPKEFLENSIVKDYLQKKAIEWNFVNTFDLMTGTLAIYAGYKNCQRYFSEVDSIESFEDLAANLGIGIFELALAVSKFNPFLLIGSVLQLAGTIKGLITPSDVVYFNKVNSQYHLIIPDYEKQLDDIVQSYELKKIDWGKQLDDTVDSYFS